MSNPVPFVMQGNNITLVIDNRSHTVSKGSHRNYDKIVDALKAQDWDILPGLVDTTKSLTKYADGLLRIENGAMFWNGREFHGALAKRLIEMYEDGFPIDAMVKFTERLVGNPSFRAVDGLYTFLEKNNLPITPDGKFLAYKKVRYSEDGQQLLDIYTKTIPNNVGDAPSVERNMVNDDPNKTCSQGLHVCAREYLDHYGSSDDPIVLVEVDPEHVVAVPYDYDHTKMRVCQYTVLSVHEEGKKPTLTNAPVQSGAVDDAPVQSVAVDDALDYDDDDDE